MPTSRPKIVKETKREIDEKAPPQWTALSPHEWLSDESIENYDRLVDSGEPFQVYLSETAERKIREHSERDASRRLEVMGLMLGDVSMWKGQVYTVVRDAATTELKNSPSKVRFDPDAFPRLFHELDDSGFDYIIVGWYHSHPGHTCFLSKTDLDTQKAMFDQPYHSALVIDPVNCDIKVFRLVGSDHEEVPFAVFKEPEGEVPGTRTVRRRKLKVDPATTI